MDVVEVAPDLRAVRVHLRRRRAAARGSRPGRRCGCGPTTRSAARCARRRTCRARRSTCASSTRRPARSTSRAPSPATPSRCTSSRWSPARDWGASAAIPFFGGLTSTDRVATLQDPLPDTTWIYELDRAAEHGHVRGPAQRPAASSCRSSRCSARSASPRPAARCAARWCPTAFGGNMDTPQMRAGTTCFLGVNVEGALFSVGDGHYRQGEGEACGTAVEGAMTTTLIVELIKGGGAGLAAARGRHALDDRRLEPAAGGRLADRPGRARALVRRAVRPAPDGRLPAALADQPRRRSPTSSTPTTAPSSRRASRCCPPADGVRRPARRAAQPRGRRSL